VPSEEDEFAWISQIEHDESYLVLGNLSSRTIKAGEQIMFFYGRYTNAYLMINYGFCFRDNRYDQLDIYLNMKPKSFNAEDYVVLDYTREEEAGIE